MPIPELWAMDFMRRAFLAGLIMGAVCPLIGTFLVLRRPRRRAGSLPSVLPPLFRRCPAPGHTPWRSTYTP